MVALGWWILGKWINKGSWATRPSHSPKLSYILRTVLQALTTKAPPHLRHPPSTTPTSIPYSTKQLHDSNSDLPRHLHTHRLLRVVGGHTFSYLSSPKPNTSILRLPWHLESICIDIMNSLLAATPPVPPHRFQDTRFSPNRTSESSNCSP